MTRNKKEYERKYYAENAERINALRREKYAAQKPTDAARNGQGSAYRYYTNGENQEIRRSNRATASARVDVLVAIDQLFGAVNAETVSAYMQNASAEEAAICQSFLDNLEA